MKGLDLKFMEKLRRSPSLKYNISSSNQVMTIHEALLDSRGFLNKSIVFFLNLLKTVAIMNI